MSSGQKQKRGEAFHKTPRTSPAGRAPKSRATFNDTSERNPPPASNKIAWYLPKPPGTPDAATASVADNASAPATNGARAKPLFARARFADAPAPICAAAAAINIHKNGHAKNVFVYS